MIKNERQNAIRNIITTRSIQNQKELQLALQERGIEVTQATVSRDIKQMHLRKKSREDGIYHYVLDPTEMDEIERQIRMLSDSVLSMAGVNNQIVIRTFSGSAHVAGEAIDNMGWSEILGTIAGDNTLLVIVRSNQEVGEVLQRLRHLMTR